MNALAKYAFSSAAPLSFPGVIHATPLDRPHATGVWPPGLVTRQPLAALQQNTASHARSGALGGEGTFVTHLGTSLEPKLTPPPAGEWPKTFSSSNWPSAGVYGKRRWGYVIGVATRSLNASESPSAVASLE